MAGHHHHSSSERSTKLLWVTLLNLGITALQFVGGVLSNSLSLLSDAIHNLGDSSAIFIAFIAGKRSEKGPDSKHTFGYKRIEILAALFNASVLIFICLFLVKEGIERFSQPEEVHGKQMFWIALAGLVANFVSVVLLHRDRDKSLNIKAAYLHLMGDTLSSVAVIIGGLAIWLWKVYWLDPVISIAVAVYIMYHTWHILKESLEILMQAAPADLDLIKVKNRIETFDAIANIHHVHAWQLADHRNHFEAHINISKDLSLSEVTTLQEQIDQLLKTQFPIHHTTLQVGYNCCSGNNDLIHHKN